MKSFTSTNPSILWVGIILLILAGVLGFLRPWENPLTASASYSQSAPTGTLPVLRLADRSSTTPTRTPFQPLPTSTAANIPTALPPTATPTPTPQPTKTATPEPSLPSEAQISWIYGTYQMLPLDCEASSAVDFAGYFGVSIPELDFQSALPTSDDPEEGFVGSPYGYGGQIPPNSYGIYPGPVARLLRSYGVEAYDQHNLSLDAVKREIADNRPVIVWVIADVLPGYAASYTASNGRTSLVAANEHVVMVIGYTQNSVLILDGGMTYTRSTDDFLNSWSVLENRAITHTEKP